MYYTDKLLLPFNILTPLVWYWRYCLHFLPSFITFLSSLTTDIYRGLPRFYIDFRTIPFNNELGFNPTQLAAKSLFSFLIPLRLAAR